MTTVWFALLFLRVFSFLAKKCFWLLYVFYHKYIIVVIK